MIRIYSRLTEALEHERQHPELNEDRLLQYDSLHTHHPNTKKYDAANDAYVLHVSLGLQVTISLSSSSSSSYSDSYYLYDQKHHASSSFRDICTFINMEGVCDVLITTQGIMIVTAIGIGLEISHSDINPFTFDPTTNTMSLSISTTEIMDDKGNYKSINPVHWQIELAEEKSHGGRMHFLYEAINLCHNQQSPIMQSRQQVPIMQSPQPSPVMQSRQNLPVMHSHQNIPIITHPTPQSHPHQFPTECAQGDCGHCFSCQLFSGPTTYSLHNPTYNPFNGYGDF